MSTQIKIEKIEVRRTWGLYLEICLWTYTVMKFSPFWYGELTSEFRPIILGSPCILLFNFSFQNINKTRRPVFFKDDLPPTGKEQCTYGIKMFTAAVNYYKYRATVSRAKSGQPLVHIYSI